MTALIVATVLLALVAGLAARYGADSRTGADPTGRDAAWPSAPTYRHAVRADATVAAGLLRGLARRARAHVRAWDALDRSLRPWDAAGARPADR